ncbi:diguanylate cyclase [Candidatus Mcinerneyibacteriota bacterium]|nr:diguanylate cyclase [Candidatus Mcinerneyibacteriota bacterium]
MKLVNGRFTIKKLLNKNNNFIVYEAGDLFFPKRELILKITVSEEKFQKDLLTKEYMVTSLYRHPLLRPIRSFHTLASIDGRYTDSSRSFYIADKMPGLFRMNPENKEMLINSLFSLISFLHANGTYHGDLRESNALRDTKRNPVFFDMSPLYVDIDMGRRADLMAFTRLMNEAGYKLSDEDVPDLRLYFPHREVISDSLQRDFIQGHACSTPFPGALILSEREISLLETTESLTTVYDYASEENARLWYQGLIPLIQAKGYEYFGLEEEKASLAEGIIKYLGRSEEEGRESVARTPEEMRAKAIRFLENKVASGPALLGLGRGEELSEEDMRFLTYLSRRFQPKDLRVVAWNRRPLPGMFPLTMAKLDEKETARVLHYYYYFVDDMQEAVKELLDQSGGEPSLVRKSLCKAADKECFKLIEARGSFPRTQGCFCTGISIAAFKGKTEEDTKEALALGRAMGGKIPQDFVEKAPVSLQKALAVLEEQDVAYRDELFYVFRLSSLIETGEKKVDPALARLVLDYFEENGFRELSYLETFVYLALNTGFGAEAYHKAMSHYLMMGVREQSVHHRFFYNLFSQIHNSAQNLTGVNLFKLYEVLYRHDFQRFIGKDVVLSQMEAFADTPLLKTLYKSYRLVILSNGDKEDIKELMGFIEKGPADHPEEWGTVFYNLLVFYVTKSEYDRVEEMVCGFREMIDGLDENRKSLFLNELMISYMDNQNNKKMEETAQQMLSIVEKNREHISLDAEFNAYNARAIAYRRAREVDRAHEYFKKALEIAQRLDDQRLIAIVSTNTGIVNIDRGEIEEAISSWIRAVRAAERIHFFHAATINTMNLAQAYKTLHYYDKAYDVISKGFDYLGDEKGVREGAKMNFLLADLLFELGDHERARAALKEAGAFFEDRPSLRECVEYLVVSLTARAEEAGLKAMEKEMDAILRRYSAEEDKKHYSTLLLHGAEKAWLSGDKDLAVRFLDTLERKGFEIEEREEKNRSDLLRAFLGSEEALERVYAAPFYRSSQMLYTLHLLVEKHEEGTALFYDVLLDLFTQMKEWLNTVPIQYRTSFMEQNKEWAFHASLLKKHGIDPVVDRPDLFREAHRDLAREMIAESKRKALEDYQLSPVNEGTGLYKSILVDLMDITGMTRGGFFEYDLYSGWTEKLVIEKEGRYHVPVPMRRDLLNEILFEKAHRDIFYHREEKRQGRNLTGILIIPVLDIEKLGRGKSKTRENRQSSFHYFALRGCLYLDTTRLLLYPDKEITEGLGPFRDFINAAGYYDYLKRTALLDRLTGLYKREHWINLTQDMLDYADKSEQQVLIAILDLDHFKNINDTYGHSRGDSVLKEMGRIVKGTVRMSDFVGRYGGEEFCVSMIIPRDADREKIIDRVRKNTENSVLNQNYKLTCSIGYALYPDDGKALEELVAKADEALYYAKESGRNRTVYIRGVPERREKEKEAKPLRDPVRESEKIDAVFDLAQKIRPITGPEAMVRQIFDLLVTYFHASSFFIVLDVSEDIYCLGLQGESSRLITDPALPGDEEKGDLIRRVDLNKRTTASVYLRIDSDRYSVASDSSYFQLLGTMIAEKIYHSFLISGRIPLERE